MQELTEFNLEKSTKRINELKKDLDENIKELSKYGITLDDVLKEMEDMINE